MLAALSPLEVCRTRPVPPLGGAARATHAALFGRRRVQARSLQRHSLLGAAIVAASLRRQKRSVQLLALGAKDANVLTVGEASELQLKALMLERKQDSDVLFAEVRPSDETGDWRKVRLEGDAAGTWTDSEADLSFSLAAGDLASALLAGRELAPSFRESAPGWPERIASDMGPWPLKGPGKIIFDSDYLQQTATALVGGEQGPVMIPAGAEKLNLSTSSIVETLFPCLMGVSLAEALCEGMLAEDLTYEELLRLSPAVRRGGVDLSRVESLADGRLAELTSQPLNMEYVSRRWAHGAVVRAVGKGGVADLAGCKPGDIIVSINGEPVLNASLEKIDELLSGSLPISLEVAQPVLQEPLYLREASTDLLAALADGEAEEAAAKLLPEVTSLMSGQMQLDDSLPQVFAGDGGSASHVHTDRLPLVQMCHVVHGIKIFGVHSNCGAEMPPWVTKWGKDGRDKDEEVALPVDQPLDQEHSSWLESPAVSIAMCRPGDVLMFWGGCPHFGANGLEAGPSVALFHGCKMLPHED